MIGRLLDQRYRVVEVLGKGGFGHTYIAEDTRRPGNPTCVVKQLKPATSDPEFLQTARRLFNSEAETLEKLGNYDQIPRLLAYFEENEEFYLVQEFIAGHTLSHELTPGSRWTESQAIQMLQEVLSILEFVHSHGVIHRDIKPDNIIRRTSDNKLVLVDFGAVKQLKMHSLMVQGSMNSQTVAIGTPGYMPSEQGQGRPRPSSDIYALGMIGVQALTGLSPTQLSEDASTGEIIWQPYAQVSDPFAAVLSKMVRHYFKYRFQSATEALQTLQPLSNPNAPQVVAAAVIQQGRNYLRSLRQIAQPDSSNNPTAPASAPQSTPPTPSPDLSEQNTVTIAPANPSTPSRGSQSQSGSSHQSPQKSILFIGAGTAIFVLGMGIVFGLRSPQPSPQPAPNQIAQEVTPTPVQPQPQITEKPEPKNNCIVVPSNTNLRGNGGRSRTGKVIKAGTKVTVTGKEENGFIEISSPEQGWIWKGRTKNTCPPK